MAKFLRHLAGFHDPEIEQALGRAGVIHLLPMYEYYATPLLSQGCAKLIVSFRQQPVQTTPSLVLGIATIQRPFDLFTFVSLSVSEQPVYALDALHSAVVTAGTYFGWQLNRAQETYERIVRENYRFHFTWGKPKASPDRKLRAHVEIDFADTVRLEIIFADPQGEIVRRYPLTVLGPGMGVVEYVLGKLEWSDNRTFKITHQNGRDHWLCGVDGSLRFVYPRAESGDAHGLFDLGRMYLEGQYILRDEVKGRQLIEAAAAKGYPHAVACLRKLSARE